jgi:DNA-binding Lrp family transcriptional regulator
MPSHLDTADIILVQMMLSDSRTPVPRIAQFLELSTEEVERRIASLLGNGVLRALITRYSPSHLKSVGVLVYGRAETTTFEDALSKLQRNDSTSWVALGSGGRMYVGATLRKLSNLESYIAFLKEETGMEELVFGIRSAPPDFSKPATPLTELERRIIRSIRLDSRKSVFEISKEVGEPVEVVGAHLDLLVQGKAIEFSAVLSPEACPDILCMFHLLRKGHQDLREFMRDKLNQHSPRILFFNTYRNLPDLVMAMVWAKDMAELREIKASLEESPAIERVEANVVLASRVVPSWADALIEDANNSEIS